MDSIPAGGGATSATVRRGADCLSWMGGGERRKEWVFVKCSWAVEGVDC